MENISLKTIFTFPDEETKIIVDSYLNLLKSTKGQSKGGSMISMILGSIYCGNKEKDDFIKRILLDEEPFGYVLKDLFLYFSTYDIYECQEEIKDLCFMTRFVFFHSREDTPKCLTDVVIRSKNETIRTGDVYEISAMIDRDLEIPLSEKSKMDLIDLIKSI